MKKKTIKEPIFTNAIDPALAEKLPDIMPVAPPIEPTDDQFTIELKNRNISEDDLHFIKQVKLNTSIDSNQSFRLFQIHLRIFGAYPAMNDRFCSACVQRCVDDIWNNVQNIYAKYILKIQ